MSHVAGIVVQNEVVPSIRSMPKGGNLRVKRGLAIPHFDGVVELDSRSDDDFVFLHRKTDRELYDCAVVARIAFDVVTRRRRRFVIM